MQIIIRTQLPCDECKMILKWNGGCMVGRVSGWLVALGSNAIYSFLRLVSKRVANILWIEIHLVFGRLYVVQKSALRSG